MPQIPVEITYIIVDCSDPENVAGFWSSLLERPIKSRKGPYVSLDHSRGEIGLAFQRVEETKRGKNRVHIDISGPDISQIKRRVETLGGRRVNGYEDGGFLVMADPEGNEFCLVPDTFNFDDSGRTDYLNELDL